MPKVSKEKIAKYIEQVTKKSEPPKPKPVRGTNYQKPEEFQDYWKKEERRRERIRAQIEEARKKKELEEDETEEANHDSN